MAPRRPVLFPEQYALAFVTVVVLLGGIALFVYLLLQHD
jgi:hypothetical protein